MTDFAAIIGPVARELWGEPNKRLSTKMELRWGSRGARLVRLDKGTWADNETGDSGGVLDLLKRERSLDPAAAHRWLQDRGLEERAQRNGHDADGDTPDGLQASGRGRIVATYDYVDESGELLFQVVRFEPKDFRQRRHGRPSDDPDRIKDGWCWSVRGVRQVPYRLPELIEAIANGQPVWIVEGEKDVDNLYRLGVPATCNAGGAGKWRAELNEYFRGADVIIVQDNDPQARNPDPPKGDGQLRWHPDGRPVLPGQDHAQAVANVDFVVAGAPTHVHTLPRPSTRKAPARAPRACRCSSYRSSSATGRPASCTSATASTSPTSRRRWASRSARPAR